MSLSDIKYIDPKSVLDIGANVAGFAFEARALWPDLMRLLMIEGNPSCYPALYASQEPFLMAYLYSKTGLRLLHKRNGLGTDTGNSFFQELTPFFQQDNSHTELVVTVKLDDLDLGQYDLIKIDSQGSELEIIRGGIELCQRAKHILMEVAIVPYNEGAPLLPEVSEFMAGIGFVVERVVDDICHPITREIVQRDILYRKL